MRRRNSPRGIARAEMVAACVIAIALLTLAFVTFVALRGEREQKQAQQQAATMDRLRRSLWRMDSQLTGIIAREAARPPEQYVPFYPADRTLAPSMREQFVPGRVLASGAEKRAGAPGMPAEARTESESAHSKNEGRRVRASEQYAQSGNQEAASEPQRGDVDDDTTPMVLVPSELLNQPDAVTKLHFQLNDAGEFASPQVPRGAQRELARLQFTTPYAIEAAERRLDELAAMLTGSNLLAASKAGRAEQRGAGAYAGEFGRKDASLRMGSAGPESAPAATQAEQIAHKKDANEAAPSTTGQMPVALPSSPASVAAASTAGTLAATQTTAQPPTVDTLKEEAAKQESAKLDGRQDGRQEGKDKQAKAATQSSTPRVAQQADADYAARRSLASATNAVQEQASWPQSKGISKPQSGEFVDLLSDDGSSTVAAQTVKVEPQLRQEGFAPQWIMQDAAPPELVFTRVVEGPWGSVRQGFWLDWQRLEAQLLESVRDTAPGAALRPVLQQADESNLPDDVMGRMLATVPAELVMPPAQLAGSEWSPLRTALVATWLLVLAALLTLAWLARAADKLAENRGRFVTAVTHELRTPLTSFCMYSQMLADDMVPDEASKREYARTLHDQSLRLSRIVESVLDYARLGRARRPVEATTVGALRSRIEPGLIAICERSSMKLEVEPPPAGWERAALRTDADTIDRVLTNLVDNACKYGATHADETNEQVSDTRDEQAGERARGTHRVQLAWNIEGQTLVVRVRDFGPGIPASDRERIFKAFERGSKHAGGNTPGLGLGLALSHALAEEIGGQLRLADVPSNEHGAAFELRLALYS